MVSREYEKFPMVITCTDRVYYHYSNYFGFDNNRTCRTYLFEYLSGQDNQK